MSNLNSIHVLVTRPAHQSQGLVTALTEQGASVLLFPALTIHPVSLEHDQTLLSLGNYDYVVFISPNAVQQGMPVLLSHFHVQHFKPLFAAVGAGTSDMIKSFGVKNVIYPESDVGAEALLTCFPNDMQSQKVYIFKGDSDNDLLEEGLTARGAMVRSGVCYQRIPTQADPAPFLDALKREGLNVMVVTSAESLRALLALIPKEMLQKTYHVPLVVVSDRVQEVAQSLGFEKIQVAKGASDTAIVSAIQLWKDSQEKYHA